MITTNSIPFRAQILQNELVRAIFDNFPKAEIMWEMSNEEIQAVEATSEGAGKYLEELGKTDLAELDYNQWMGFLMTVVSGYLDKMSHLYSPYAPIRSDEAPF